MTNLDQRISQLQPGASFRVSGDSATWVTAERSGDGKTIRFVRHTPSGFVVFRSESF